MRTAEMLGTGEKGRYILAATFGNVHGSYKPGSVKLRPEILKEIQDEVGTKLGKDKPFELVFHGGSGSELDEIREAVELRRREDERRHRHAVRVQPRDRRPLLHQLRRRAQGRRRGRQQEGLRPAQLHEAGRGRHGQARRRGVRGAAVGGDVSPPPDAVRAPTRPLRDGAGAWRLYRTVQMYRPVHTRTSSGSSASAGFGVVLRSDRNAATPPAATSTAATTRPHR